MGARPDPLASSRSWSSSKEYQSVCVVLNNLKLLREDAAAEKLDPFEAALKRAGWSAVVDDASAEDAWELPPPSMALRKKGSSSRLKLAFKKECGTIL